MEYTGDLLKCGLPAARTHNVRYGRLLDQLLPNKSWYNSLRMALSATIVAVKSWTRSNDAGGISRRTL